jgi:diguanylate cyclase
MFDGYDFWLILLSVLITSITLYFSCSFITRIYLSTPAQKATLLPTYSVMIGSLLFCLDNLNWVAMQPVVTGAQFSVPMMLGSLFAAMFATFIVFSNASQKSLPFNALINRGFIVSLASYAMFYMSFASRHPANTISVDLTSLSIALVSGTCISAAVILYYFKMKHYAEARPILLKAALSLGTGLLIVILYAIFNTSLYVQQQILAEGNHVVNHREAIATIISLAIVSLLALTIGAPKYIEQFKTHLSKFNLLDNHHDDDLNAKDTLTLLPNRQGFEAQLNAAKRSACMGKTFALAFIDLDHFKPINDTYGHHVGDAVLVAVAQRLNATVRACDYVARLGGDEFVAIIEDITVDEDITPIIGRVLDAINETFHIGQHDIHISCSVGIAVYPGDGDINKLMICADAAMYKAKENGKNQFKFFDAEIELASDQMLEMHRDLRQAIDNDEFLLLFQPKIDCKTQLPVGAEALIRWNHPTKGLLLPDTFLPAAERFGLINSINEWVVQECCRTIYQAKKVGINLNISINLASQQFRNANLVVEILEAIRRNDISASNLMFEIKETTAINNEAQFMTLLADFKNAHIKVALDDFGSHNFNLSYLQNLHVDEVKLDRVFIAQMNGTKASHAVVDAVIRLAHALDLNVVAEGVETEAQRTALTELGCNQMQGYLFSKAVPEKKLFALFNQTTLNIESNNPFLLSEYQASSVISNVLKTVN